MKKVVINAVHGGFGLSPKALLRLWEMGCKDIACPIDEYFGEDDGSEYQQKYGKKARLEEWRNYLKTGECERFMMTVFTPCEQFVLSCVARDIKRDDPMLIQVLEELKEEANGELAELKIVEIPADVKWHIAEYDGVEWVAEDHRTWS